MKRTCPGCVFSDSSSVGCVFLLLFFAACPASVTERRNGALVVMVAIRRSSCVTLLQPTHKQPSLYVLYVYVYAQSPLCALSVIEGLSVGRRLRPSERDALYLYWISVRSIDSDCKGIN